MCASPRLLDSVGEPFRPETLSALPCVRFTGISSASEWEFVDGEKRLTVPIKSMLTCNQVGASMEACAAGVGFGRFFCYQVTPLIKTGKLVTVLTDFEPSPFR